MKNSTKVILVISIISSIIGGLAKIKEYKVIGDVFLAISVVTYFYLLYRLFVFIFHRNKSR
jgi:hypothetical protein